MRKIVCAALRSTAGDLILGPRHFDSVMHQQINNYKLIHHDWRAAEQGFIDQHGVFLDRLEAFQVATEANQIVRQTGSEHNEKLYSENLY